MCPFFLCVSSAFALRLRKKNASKVISVGVSPCVRLRYPLLVRQKNLTQAIALGSAGFRPMNFI